MFGRTPALSRAALEVLAIVAYKQPIARAGIERIRGTSSDSALETLLMRELVALNEARLCVTTRAFLDFAGLRDLADLDSAAHIGCCIAARRPASTRGLLSVAATPLRRTDVAETMRISPRDSGGCARCYRPIHPVSAAAGSRRPAGAGVGARVRRHRGAALRAAGAISDQAFWAPRG